MLLECLKDKRIQILISIIWGLGIAIFFRKSCNGRNCIVIKGPRAEDMDNKIYSFNDKCYKYTAKNTSCKAPANADNIQTIDTRT
jgi:hypothetical protein